MTSNFDPDFIESFWAQKNYTSKTAKQQKFHTKEFCNKHKHGLQNAYTEIHIIHIPFSTNFASKMQSLKNLIPTKMSLQVQA